MQLVQSKLTDIPAIMKIIGDAQEYLAALNIDQWQDGYPNEEQIELDLENKDSYVVLNEDNVIMGTTVFTTKKETTYAKIEGEWLTKDNSIYGVIHRLAVSNNFRSCGLAKFVFTESENRLKKMGVKSMRIDTHRDNLGMQHMLSKRDYKYCGIIILDSGDERLAYEKLIG